MAGALPFVGQAFNKARSLYFSLIQSQIVCIDDLERRSKNLDLKDVLGLISFLREQRGCKVALLLNAEKLGDNKGEFDGLFEKVVEDKAVLAPTAGESAALALPSQDNISAALREHCVTLGIQNIRVIKQIERLARRIDALLIEFPKPIRDQAVYSLTLFGWSKYDHENAPGMEFLKHSTLARHMLRRDAIAPQPEKEMAWDSLLEKYKFRRSDNFDLALMKYVDSMILNSDQILMEARELKEQRRVEALRGTFSASWRAFHDSFDDDEDKVVQELVDSSKRSYEVISLSNLNETVLLLKALEREAAARDLLTFFADNRTDVGYWNSQGDPFSRGPFDPDLGAIIEAKKPTEPGEFDVATGLIQAGKTYDAETISKLATVPAQTYSLAKAAELSTDRLQEVKFAANVGGVSNEDFAASLHTSLALLDEAQRQVNTLSRLFNANGLSIKDSNGDLIKFDALLERAASLMARAPSEQAKVKIAEMLGLTRDWIRVLDGGPVAFRKLTDEARAAGVIVDEATIQKAKDFDREWTATIVKFKAGMVSALADLNTAFAEFWRDVIDSIPGGNFIKNAFRAWGRDLHGMKMPELEAALSDAIENGIGGGAEAERIQDEIDRRLGKKPLKIRLTAEVAGPETVIPKDHQKNAFDRAVFETNKRIAATDAETRTIGLNSEARERAKIVAELEESAKKANTEAGFQNATVTDAQRQKINQLADAMEAAAKRQRQAQTQFKAFNDVLQFSGSLAVDFIDKLGDRTAKLNALMLSAIKSIERATIQAALLGQGPLAGMFGTNSTVSGGTGGIFGAIGKLFGGARAGGGPVDPSRAYVVGENRPELFVPDVPGRIMPDIGKIGGVNGVGSVTHHHQTNNVTVNASGGDGKANQDLAERVGRAVADSARSMVSAEIRTQLRPGGILRG